jgi:thioredoxin-dependent peroxiredoxin
MRRAIRVGVLGIAGALAGPLGACGGSQASGGTSTEAPAREGLVQAGERAPAFMLQDQSGRVRELSEYRNRPVVLYFYPRDATPGCTREACAFRDAWESLQATGAVVLGVSTDDVESHRRFHAEHELPFDLLADLDGRVAQQYGVPLRMGMAGRVTFLIDGSGVVRRVFEQVDPGVHADEVLAAIQALPASEGGGTGIAP